MLDIFGREDIQKLFNDKSVVLMGDSNVRALYKDFLCLLRNTEFISERILKQKMENSCYGDKLVYHGEKSNGREYREERAAKINTTSLSYFFLTRVYDNYVKESLKIIMKKGPPDILIMNSCLWDVTRWGPSGVEEFKVNLKVLMKELKNIMPACLVIWVTTPPIATEVRGGFLLKELQFLKYSLRFHVVEANHYARKIVVENGFDILDTHYHLKMQIHRRENDGIHWNTAAVRYITNLLLTHISLAWSKPLPHRYNSEIMEQNLEAVMQQDEINNEISKSEETKNTTHEAKSRDVSSTAQDTIQKNGKENTKTSKRKRKKRNANSPICWGASPAHVRNTHHAFLNRVQNEQRHKRIRQWKQPAAINPSHCLSPYALPVSPAHQYAYRNIQHEPGYFSNPGQFQNATHEAGSEIFYFTAQDTNQKNGKENYQTPKRKKRNVYSSSVHATNAHHAFINSAQKEQRHIRQRQQPATTNPSHCLSPYSPLLSPPSRQYEYHDIEHESGYFSSPGQFQVSFSNVSPNSDFACHSNQSPLPIPYMHQYAHRPRYGINMADPYGSPYMQ